MIPTTITIMGIKFKVDVLDLTKEYLCGDSCLAKKLIRINSQQTLEEQKSTLYHECLHMALHISGVSSLLTDDLEEAIVICIENAIFPLIKLT